MVQVIVSTSRSEEGVCIFSLNKMLWKNQLERACRGGELWCLMLAIVQTRDMYL